MAITNNAIELRDARNRLIDLLGIGQSYPLRDITVRDEQLTVAFGTTAKIPLSFSQPGVTYLLCDKQGKPIERTVAGKTVPITAEGNGGELLLETLPMQEDTIFKILARNSSTGREQYLRQPAEVKVGLDTALVAWIHAVPLDPTIATPASIDPRIVNYGAVVEVEIANSQEGVDYRLVYFRSDNPGQEVTLSHPDQRGNLKNLILQTDPVMEDIDIRIRATKVFDPSEHRPTQTALLDIVLPLKVRANPALAVNVDPSVVDFNHAATLTIAATQTSAQYQLYRRRLPDSAVVHGAAPATVLKVPVTGRPDILIRPPDWQLQWSLPTGYTEAGGWQQGNGGNLTFSIEGLTEDTLFIVQARKVHSYDGKTLPSAIQLQQAAVVLTRPDPAPPLRLSAALAPIQVRGGQPGVFYYFSPAAGGTALGPSVYFQQTDADDSRQNKGIGQVVMTVDFVIAPPLPPSKIQSYPGLAFVPPEPPILVVAALLQADSKLSIRAVKAQTGLDTTFERTTAELLPPGPPTNSS